MLPGDVNEVVHHGLIPVNQGRSYWQFYKNFFIVIEQHIIWHFYSIFVTVIKTSHCKTSSDTLSGMFSLIKKPIFNNAPNLV
jgi:hypothetical protein